ncbi:MAG: hypothetical protein ABIQ09_06470 [Jatrophihabitantaceae bacterium]
MKLGVVIVTAVLGLALAGCGDDGDTASDAVAGLSSITSSASATGSLSGSATKEAPAEAFEAAAAAESECGQKTTPRPELLRQLPAGFPTVTGWQPIEVVNQGQTRAVSGALRGEVTELVTVRDNAADEIVAEGYEQTGSEEEVGYEAEAEFEGPQEVSIKVRPLCRDHLVLTYTVRQ